MKLIAFIILLSKSWIALERFLDNLMKAIDAERRQENAQQETLKNERDIALIRAPVEQLRLCSTCPFGDSVRGQHSNVTPTPAIQTRQDGGA